MFVDEHNHDLSSPKFCEMLRSQSKMPNTQVDKMNGMRLLA